MLRRGFTWATHLLNERRMRWTAGQWIGAGPVWTLFLSADVVSTKTRDKAHKKSALAPQAPGVLSQPQDLRVPVSEALLPDLCTFLVRCGPCAPAFTLLPS